MIRVPPSGPLDARIMIIGEAPGRDEEARLQPFVGASGLELTKMLHEAGISRSDCYITNVVKFRPPGNDISEFFFDKACKKPQQIILDGVAELKKEIEQVKPRVIIALGNTPMWALTDRRGITDWRGSFLRYGESMLIPTYHPAAVLRQWDWRPVAVHDLRRARQCIEAPPVAPAYSFTIRPSIEAVIKFLADIRRRADNEYTTHRPEQFVCQETGTSSSDEAAALNRTEATSASKTKDSQLAAARNIVSSDGKVNADRNSVSVYRENDRLEGSTGGVASANETCRDLNSVTVYGTMGVSSSIGQDRFTSSATGAGDRSEVVQRIEPLDYSSPSGEIRNGLGMGGMGGTSRDKLRDVSKEVSKESSGTYRSVCKNIYISVDIETRKSLMSCVGIAVDESTALNIPLMCVERQEGYWTEEEEVVIWHELKLTLTHPNIKVIGQNFLYDAQYFARYMGFVPRLADDTMWMQHICFPGLPKGLDFLSSMYCKYHTYWKHEGREWDPRMPEEQHWAYNCKDAVITFEVWQVLNALIDKFHLREQYNFQMSLFQPVLRMMLRGVRIDIKLRNELSFSLEDELVKRQQFVNTAVGHAVNINSPKQLQELFYNEFNMSVINKRSTGRPTTDDDALKKFALREPVLKPLVQRINECRSIKTFLSNFVQAELGPDKRLRCSFNPAGTETYRFNSSTDAFGSGTNLQNVPRGEEENEGTFTLPKIRRMFIPDPGYVFYDADLAGADAQVVAWEAGDNVLKQMFRERVKIHAENAKLIYKGAAGADGKREPYYTRAKMGVHATNYGASARTVAAAIGVTVSEAEEFQHIWFSAHPQIRTWHHTVMASLQNTRSVSNKFGYRRIYFDRIDSILPEALAWIPQSTVACTINRGLVNIEKNLPNVHILLQVHDSLLLQLPIAKADELRPQILEQLKIVIPYEDPLVIPAGLKVSERSWGDCK